MKIGNHAQVNQLNQNQDVKATGTGNMKGLVVSIGNALKKVGQFFTETLPNFFKSLSQRSAVSVPPGNQQLAHGNQKLTDEELQELRSEFEQFNERQTYLETEEQANILEKNMDNEVVISKQPPNDKPQVKSSSDIFEDLEHSLKEDIAQNKKKLDTEVDNVLRDLEFGEKGDKVTASPEEMDKFISNAAKKLHGDREFSSEDVNQLINDLGGPLTNDERIENAASNIAGKQDFSLNDLEKLMQDLDDPSEKQEQPKTPPQELKKVDTHTHVSAPRTDFLPRPTGNPFEKFKIDK